QPNAETPPNDVHVCRAGSLPCRSGAHTYLYVYPLNDTPPYRIYTLSLHDALPISIHGENTERLRGVVDGTGIGIRSRNHGEELRSEEHTSELQSHLNLVCRLLLEKKQLIPILLRTIA